MTRTRGNLALRGRGSRALLEHVVMWLQLISWRNVHKVLWDGYIRLSLLLQISLIGKGWSIINPLLLVVGINVLLRWVLELLVHPIFVDGLLLLLVVETVELLLLVRNWPITTVLLVRDV